MRETYDIIDWKSCASSRSRISTGGQKQERYSLSRDGIYSTTDVVFPKLFHEDAAESEGSSIISMPDVDFGDHLAIHSYKENTPDHLGEQSVYQKVSNWVLSQRRYFLNIEATSFEDDDIEVIDPVDLFHETVLDEYFLVTENDCERRAIFRELKSSHYEIQSIEESMQTYDYRFLRKPEPSVEIELTPLITFHELHKNYLLSKSRRKMKNSSSTLSGYIENEEESIAFLGVPRLLENYVILNREGDVVKTDIETDLWLSPLQEDLVLEDANKASNQDELDFLSSWFSDVYQDVNTDENRTFITDKVTVISVSRSDDEVWMDAPEIPHWLDDDEHEELELFNQPARPLYYYRDRIKGCYRIIGVEDEPVVLFSGNDDDNIFYNENDDFFVANTFPEPKITRTSFPNTAEQHSQNRSVPLVVRYGDVDLKNDSGIEDIDDLIGEEIAVASLSLTSEEIEKLSYLKRKEFLAKESTLVNRKYVWGIIVCICFLMVLFSYSELFGIYNAVDSMIFLRSITDGIETYQHALNEFLKKVENLTKT